MSDQLLGMLQQLLPYAKVGIVMYLVYVGFIFAAAVGICGLVAVGFWRRRRDFDDFVSRRR